MSEEHPTVHGIPTGTHCPAGSAVRPLVLLGLLGLLAVLPVRAQETLPGDSLASPRPDTLASPDTLSGAAPDTRFRPDSVRLVRAPVGFEAGVGTAIGPVRPARQPALSAVDLLERMPGSFVYRFGDLGWPDGWSPYGLPPQHVDLLLNGWPFEGLVTGRPRYDLLPLAFLAPLRSGPGRHGAAATTYAEMYPYAAAEPLTELRYQAGGMQSVTAVHVQRRRRPLFGRPGILDVLVGYGGHGADGEYPGSRLRRARQVLGRLRYEQAAVSVEVANLHTRWQLGAHGGVLPQAGQSFTSIYERFGAQVAHAGAERQTLRNDLSATLRARLLPGFRQPLTVSAGWTSEIFRYTNPGADTLDTRAHRYGLRVEQAVRLGPQHLRLRAEGWTDRLVRSNALPDSLGQHRRQLHLSVRDSLAVGRLAVVAEGGFHTGTQTFPSAAAHVGLDLGRLRLFAEAHHTGLAASWIEAHGYGRFVAPPEALPDRRLTLGRAGLALRLGPLTLAAEGFVHEIQHPADLFVVGDDSLAVRTAASPFRRAGLTGTLGWRHTAARGLYLHLQPTASTFLTEPDSDLHARVAASLPALFGEGRLGARFRLFRGDLDANAYLRGRFWSEMRSRTLHAPTGLLAVPSSTARTFGPSGTLDVVLEATVRTATLFLVFENGLSGTPLQPGTLVVPVYPLPEQRFRFGVFWPIRG
ncbi:hypothetical protein AWN76_009060 [Rhodothermaceae bacterium RA]|nr:hypothetical protein AWN76_009060 [Rhodothermaceae bacterium RA]